MARNLRARVATSGKMIRPFRQRLRRPPIAKIQFPMKTTLVLLVIAGATNVCLSASVRAEERRSASEGLLLPGLAVSLGISVDEVGFQLQHFKFRHIPEKRWQRNGHSFVSPELIVRPAVLLQGLNEQLEKVRCVFEMHTLVRVELTIQNVHKAIQLLIDILKLVKTGPDTRSFH